MADLGDDTSGPWAMSKSDEKVAVEAIGDEEKIEEMPADSLKGEDSLKSEKKDPNMHILEPEEEDEMWEKVNERKMSYVLPPRPARGSQVSFVPSKRKENIYIDWNLDESPSHFDRDSVIFSCLSSILILWRKIVSNFVKID